MVESDENAIVPWDDKPKPLVTITASPPPPRRRRLLWFLIGLILGTLLTAGIILSIFGLEEPDETMPAAEVGTPVAQVVEVTREVPIIHTQVVTHEVIVEITTTPLPTPEPIMQEVTRIVIATSLSDLATPIPSEVETMSTTQPTEQVSIEGPSGDWAVRTYRTDDANLILVNTHIVAGTLYNQTTDWINITNILQRGVPNYVTAINLNAGVGSSAVWGFSIAHADTVVWGNEGNSGSCKLCYTQTVEISPDNIVSESNLRDFNKSNLSGTWTARAIASDMGVMMVNGVAASGGYKGQDPDWNDITGLLYSGQDNIISVAVWNQDGDYSWDFSLRKGETILWGSSNQGSGQVGEVFYITVVVDGEGNIVP